MKKITINLSADHLPVIISGLARLLDDDEIVRNEISSIDYSIMENFLKSLSKKQDTYLCNQKIKSVIKSPAKITPSEAPMYTNTALCCQWSLICIEYIIPNKEIIMNMYPKAKLSLSTLAITKV